MLGRIGACRNAGGIVLEGRKTPRLGLNGYALREISASGGISWLSTDECSRWKYLMSANSAKPAVYDKGTLTRYRTYPSLR